jgi:trimeric autotransporter adhesin
MTHLFARCNRRSHSRKNHLVLFLILVALVQISGCGGSGNGNGNGNSNGSGSGTSSPTAYIINTVAGGGPNNLAALKASVAFPSGIAQDAAGNTYIATGYFDQVLTGDGGSPFALSVGQSVLRVGTDGNLTVVAGNGTQGYSGDGGQATQAQLNDPSGVSVDNSGNIFIADTDNCVIREVIATTGVIQTVAGNNYLCVYPGYNYSGDGGKATQAQLGFTRGVFVDRSGNIFIADSYNGRIREVVATTGIIQTVAKLGSAFGVFVDSSGNIFIADASNNAIREVLATTGVVQTVAGNGTPGYAGDGGLATLAQLNDPSGVSVDSSGNIFIADTGNNAIREVLATTGIIRTVAGNGTPGYSGDGGPATQAQLSSPMGLSVDGSGNILIADTQNNVIREVGSTEIIETVAGNGFQSYSGDGHLATEAQLDIPGGVSVDISGNLFIADGGNNVIREVVAKTGIIQNVAGNGTLGYSGDGGPATQAELAGSWGVSVDRSGNIFIADGTRIREVVAKTGIIRTVAGNGTPGYSGDGGPATQAGFNSLGVFVDSSGNIFIVDFYRIREVVAKTGIIRTVAGNGTTGYSGDGGPATQAQIGIPEGVFVDSSGNIFIAEIANCDPIDPSDDYGCAVGSYIRKVDAATGVIHTVAGNGTEGYSGDGGKATQAELYFPFGVVVDSSGNIFIADSGNRRIREVLATTGIIQTVAGNGKSGFSGDGAPATRAELNFPFGLAINSADDILFADSYDQENVQLAYYGGTQGGGRVRKLVPR